MTLNPIGMVIVFLSWAFGGLYELLREWRDNDPLLEWNRQLRQDVLDAIRGVRTLPVLTENPRRSIIEIVDEVVSEKPIRQPYIWMTN